MLWDSCCLWRTSICPVYNSKEGKNKEKVWCTILWSPAMSQLLLWRQLPDGGSEMIPEEVQTDNLQENCLDNKRQDWEDLKLWTADNTGQRHMMEKVWHSGDIVRIWGPAGDLGLMSVPNPENTHRTKSSIRIIPELLPLSKKQEWELLTSGGKENALLFPKDRTCCSYRSRFSYFLLNSGLLRTEELLHDAIHQWES